MSGPGRALEDSIKVYLGRDAKAEEPGLLPGDFEAGLLAGRHCSFYEISA